MKLYRKLIVAAVVLALTALVAIAGKPASKDFIAYWSAGHQLSHHRDPYAREEIYALELQQGLESAKPLIMRNPPWSLFVAYPLGLTPPRIGLAAWTALAVGSVAICFSAFNIPARDRLLGHMFAPVYANLAVGQSSPFLLLGLSLFVMFYQSRPYVAGASLLFLLMKPHLFLVLLPVIFIDALYRKSWRVLAGAAGSMSLANWFAYVRDPRIWHQYFTMLKDAHIDQDFIPSPVASLSVLLTPHQRAIQFLPSALAIIWGLSFYWKRRRTWNWATDPHLILLITVIVSPYEWMTDEIILLPAILLALSLPDRPRHVFAMFMVANTVALMLLINQVQLTTGVYVWTSLAWFFIYKDSHAGPVRTSSHRPDAELLQAA